MRFSLAVAGLLVWGVGCGSADHASEGESHPSCDEVYDGGEGIEAPPDGAALCPGAACNYQTNQGCGSDEACLPAYTEGTLEVFPACVAASEGTAGDSCVDWAVPSDCAPGFFCADGTCRRLCCGGDWSACDPGTSCFRPLFIRLPDGDGTQDISAEVGLCFPTGTCSVLDPESCADEPGRTCKIVDPTGAEACVRSGQGKAGEPCTSAEFCGVGLSCVADVCRRLCRAEVCGEPGCSAEEGVCVHMDRNPDGVGECTPGFVPED